MTSYCVQYGVRNVKVCCKSAVIMTVCSSLISLSAYATFLVLEK